MIFQRIRNTILYFISPDIFNLPVKIKGALNGEECVYLFLLARKINGTILEFGAWQGLSTNIFLKTHNKVITYESFNGLENLNENDKLNFQENQYKSEKIIFQNNLPAIRNHILKEGNVFDTFKNYVPFYMAFLDLDLEEPTRHVLHILKESKNAIIVVHDIQTKGIQNAIESENLDYFIWNNFAIINI